MTGGNRKNIINNYLISQAQTCDDFWKYYHCLCSLLIPDFSMGNDGQVGKPFSRYIIELVQVSSIL